MNFDFANWTIVIAAMITGVISPIIVQVTQHLLKSRFSYNKKNDLNKNSTLSKDSLITSKLRKILEKYRSDRVSISEFHNGGNTYSGKSFQRFSTTYEVVVEGVSSEATRAQGIPTSVFSDFFKSLESCTHVLCEDVSKCGRRLEDPICNSLKSFLIKRGSKSVLFFQIRDIQSNFVGFLCIEGVINNLKLDLDEIEELALISSNLAGYLEE
jgi:hypothetical protein